MAAEPIVAIRLPRAAPTMVPVTPKSEAITVARMAATTEPMTWGKVTFFMVRRGRLDGGHWAQPSNDAPPTIPAVRG